MKRSALFILVLLCVGSLTSQVDRGYAQTVSTDGQIPPSGIENYERIRAEFSLFGKWKVCSPYTDKAEQGCYIMEIYTNGNEYVSFKAEGEYSAALLEKEGNRFTITPDGFGLYFIIDSDKVLTMFTPEGIDLSTLGYRVNKM